MYLLLYLVRDNYHQQPSNGSYTAVHQAACAANWNTALGHSTITFGGMPHSVYPWYKRKQISKNEQNLMLFSTQRVILSSGGFERVDQ